jgi:hypothetical protein
VFTARYDLSPYIKQIRFVFKPPGDGTDCGFSRLSHHVFQIVGHPGGTQCLRPSFLRIEYCPRSLRQHVHPKIRFSLTTRHILGLYYERFLLQRRDDRELPLRTFKKKYGQWFQVSAAMLMTSALFWDITQRRMIILYRRFGTTYRSHLPRSKSPRTQEKKTSWPLMMGRIRCPENVGKLLSLDSA